MVPISRCLLSFLVCIARNQPLALAREEGDLIEHPRDVLALLLQGGATLLKLGKELHQLPLLVLREVIQLKQLPDLVQRESESLAPKCKLEPHPVTIAEHPYRTFPLRTEESLLLIVAYG